MSDEDKLDKLIDDESHAHPAPMLQMDGIRIATLAVLSVDTLVVILLAVFLVTNVQNQRQVNECYQDLLDDTLAWAHIEVSASKQGRHAQRELLWAQLAAPEGDGRAAIERYIDQLDDAERARTTTPPPAQRCAR